jgi:SAM-dependent methyltransferase
MKKHPEDDHIGFQTLDNISEADHLNGWMFNTIRPYCSGHILEVGSGIGNISKFLLEGPYQVTLSDFRDSYCQRLRDSFAGQPALTGVVNIDLVDGEFEKRFEGILGSFDTIIALNVVEHIRDDHAAIRNLHRLLRTGGKLIVLVPAFEFLYNAFDYNLGHYRRYRSGQLSDLMLQEGFTIRRSWYFNSLGMPGWFISGTLLRNKAIPQGHVWIYNKIVFLSKILDKLVSGRIGLSTICVGVKS